MMIYFENDCFHSVFLVFFGFFNNTAWKYLEDLIDTHKDFRNISYTGSDNSKTEE